MPDLEAQLTAALAQPGAESSDFDLNPEVGKLARRTLRPAGVLIPISVASGTPRVILTKRSSRLKHHPGQIAFPGGKVDASDVDATDAALREAREEIGLPRGHVNVLGEMPPHETVTGFRVTPILSIIERDFDIVPERGEVEEVFSVPLSHVTTPQNFIVESRRWAGSRRYYYTVPFGPYYIWGATARMLRALAARLNP